LDLKYRPLRNSNTIRLKNEITGEDIFIADHLTKLNSSLLRKTNFLVQKNLLHAAWYLYSNGRVYVKEKEDSEKTRMTREDQLPVSKGNGEEETNTSTKGSSVSREVSNEEDNLTQVPNQNLGQIQMSETTSLQAKKN